MGLVDQGGKDNHDLMDQEDHAYHGEQLAFPLGLPGPDGQGDQKNQEKVGQTGRHGSQNKQA